MITQRLLDDFNESPMCTLSLSSKELFHSNMLALLFRKFPSFLSEFLGCSDHSPAEITREEHNIDLTIKTPASTYYIENKVKSVSDCTQLEKYMTRHDGHFILLTLMPPAFDPAVLPKPLRVISYRETAEMIRKIPADDAYFRKIIEDYLFLLSTLEEIAASVSAKSDTEPLFLDKNIHSLLSTIRMQDIGQKIRFSSVLHFFRSGSSDLYDEFSISLSHSKVLLDMKKTIGDYRIGIQIQEGHYRRLIESTNKQSVRKIADELRKNNLWFVDEFQSDTFNMFGEVFLYTKVRVDNDTIRELAERTRRDGEYLKQNMESISRIVSRA